MAPASAISLSAAFIMGIAGSAHCFAMCGGLAGALGMRARHGIAGNVGALRATGLYQIGRLTSYAAAGALCGAVGAALQLALDLTRVASALRIASGVVLVLVASRLLSGWNALAGLERLGARVWSTLQPLARHAATQSERRRALMLGLLWGWLPCGMVYSMLMFAGMSGSPWGGAAVMTAFGAGTVPSMLMSGLLASQLQRSLAHRHARLVSGLLLVVFGIWMIAAGLSGQLDPHAHH